MANWFSTDSGPFDPNTFNYDTAAQKVARQKAAAQALQQSSLAPSQGQFIQNGAGTFYAGGNSKATIAAKLIAALLGNQAVGAADDSQKQLAADSQNAFNAQYANLNGPGAAQAKAQLPTASAQDMPANAVAQDDSNPEVQTSPVAPQAPNTSTPIPAVQSITPAAKSAAVHALTGVTGTGSGRGKQGGPTASEVAIHDAEVAGTDPLADFRARQQAQAAKNAALNGGAAVPSARLNALASAQDSQSQQPQSPIVYQTTASQLAAQNPQAPANPVAAAAAAALQGNSPAANAPASPQIAPTAQPQALPATQVAAPQATAQQLPQQATPAPQQGPSDAEMVSRLVALGRTGPEGQQVAQAALNNLFASKNGRFSTAVHADPVNGGFIQVVTDTRTGQSQASPIGASTGSKVLETKDTPNGLMERTGQGWRQAVDQNGQRIIGNPTAADQRADRSQANDIAKAQTANKSALGAIDATLARLDRIEHLYDNTMTGPISGHLPNWNSNRQELAALNAQDIFAETKDAVTGAADAGGAPRMAASEFNYMKNNGGLSQTTNPEAAKNLIAQQRLRLNSMRDALTTYGQQLGGSQPQQGALPTRQPGQAPQQLSYGSFGGNH